MTTCPTILSLFPRQFKTGTPTSPHVLVRPENESRQSRPTSLRVPALTFRRVTLQRMSFSEPLVEVVDAGPGDWQKARTLVGRAP